MLTNTLVWLGMNSVAAYVTYYRAQLAGSPSTYATIWIEYIPWWGHWIWLAPLLVTCIAGYPLQRSKLSHSLLFNVCLFIVTMLLYWFACLLSVALLKKGELTPETLSYTTKAFLMSPYYLDVVVYAAVACVGYVRAFDARVRKEQMRNKELAHQLVQTELDSLKAQLNPHFLFNTLNSIAGLIRAEDKQSALVAMSQLSMMLRKVLENQSSQMIPLSQELEFTESYFAIQKTRFGEKFRTEIDVADECNDHEVPFMLLQPLVENAVKHCTQLATNGNLLLLKVFLVEDFLHIVLINKFVEDSSTKGFGIGIDNSHKRLMRIYQENYQLKLAPVGDGYFETKVIIPAGGYDD